MPGPLRVVAGLVVLIFVTAYYLLGMMFILGAPSDTGYNISFGVFGMLGICGPLILLGVHLAFMGPRRGARARGAMVWVLGATQVIGIAGMAPQVIPAATRIEALQVVLSGLVSAGLFGWPMVVAMLRDRGT